MPFLLGWRMGVGPDSRHGRPPPRPPLFSDTLTVPPTSLSIHIFLRARAPQFYQQLPPTAITDEYLWGRLEPLLTYMSASERDKVRENGGG